MVDGAPADLTTLALPPGPGPGHLDAPPDFTIPPQERPEVTYQRHGFPAFHVPLSDPEITAVLASVNPKQRMALAYVSRGWDNPDIGKALSVKVSTIQAWLRRDPMLHHAFYSLAARGAPLHISAIQSLALADSVEAYQTIANAMRLTDTTRDRQQANVAAAKVLDLAGANDMAMGAEWDFEMMVIRSRGGRR